MAPRPLRTWSSVSQVRLRRPDGRQFFAACQQLKETARHGSWAFAVDLPSSGKRRLKGRSGFPTRGAARAALAQALETKRTGTDRDPNLTVAAYLATWLRGKQE